MNPHVPEIADAASERDREWFARHPERRHRVRPFIPGELPLHPAAVATGSWFTVVKLVRAGMRVRLSVRLPSAPGPSEAQAEHLFVVAMHGTLP